MKRHVIRLLSLVLVVLLGLTGFAPAANAGDSLTGNYQEDTLAVVDSLRTAINLPDGTPEKKEAQTQARQLINDFAARYRRNGSVAKLSSFTTMRTALNSLAGHYSSYPNRPVPQKLKDRLELEFKQVEAAVNRGN
jgi:photosystem II Psb27 protein